MGVFHYFRWAFLFTVIALLLGGWLGWMSTSTFVGTGNVVFICSVLILLEISLSIDNSIINARVLCDMTQKWQKRFFTWGITIAVFGMRIIFPVIIIATSARLDPISAFQLAIWEPQKYTAIMMSAHVGISAFGGTFLMMVGLSYFFNTEKDVHWIYLLEERAKNFSSVHGIECAITLVFILFFTGFVDAMDRYEFLIAAACGILIFFIVEALGTFLNITRRHMDTVHRSEAITFIYLEVLDASFSFDGVISAFALSTNFLVVAISLGVGAFYVRSMTIMLVEKKILDRYRYLEHGAFYTILILAVGMYMQTLMHIPEVISGLIGSCFILSALYSSIRYNHKIQRAKAKH